MLVRAKKEAARRGVTLTTLIDQGLRLALRNPLKSADRPQVVLPLSTTGGGTMPGVNLDDSAALLDMIERVPGRHDPA